MFSFFSDVWVCLCFPKSLKISKPQISIHSKSNSCSPRLIAFHLFIVSFPIEHTKMATISPEKFYQRMDRLKQSWISQKTSVWNNADCLVILFNNSNENIYSKPASMHLYLFGYEDFTDSIIVITRDTFYFLASNKKCQLLQTELAGKGEGYRLEFIEKSKDEVVNNDNFGKLVGALKKAGIKNFGTFIKDQLEGNFLKKFAETLEAAALEKVDISAGIGLFLAVKEEAELVSCNK
jgi:nucleosome binding factor SPN SPT16 subunit